MVVATLESGEVSSGIRVIELESMFRDFTQKRHAVSFNSWTSAAFSFFTYLSKRRPNSKVIVPSFSFSATANVVKLAGLRVIFADVNLEDGSLDFDSVIDLMDDDVSAIMTVHYAGIFGRDTERLARLCEEHEIFFVEDAAEAIGANSISGQQAGGVGVGIFSFFATKNITCGEGGVLTTDSSELRDELTLFRGHGVLRNLEHPWQRNAVVSGQNFRLSNLNAALAASQMQQLEELNRRRRLRARQYQERLASNSAIRILGENGMFRNSWQMLPVVVNDGRNQLVYELLNNGIEASVHFDPPIHLQSGFESELQGSQQLSNTEFLSSRVITLPIHPNISEDEVDYVCKTLLEAIRKT